MTLQHEHTLSCAKIPNARNGVVACSANKLLDRNKDRDRDRDKDIDRDTERQRQRDRDRDIDRDGGKERGDDMC